MSETAAGSTTCSLCFTKPMLLLCALASVPFLLGVLFLPLLVTVSVLVLSTVLLVTFTKKKVALDLNPDPVQDDELMSCSSSNQMLHEYALESPEIEMESESDDDDDYGLIRSQDLDGFNWDCADNVDEGSTETSDDSDSGSSDDLDDEDVFVDDDNLIEIALPKQSNSEADLVSESILGQQGVVELLEEMNDMNEEDNLIEIDIFKFDVKTHVF